MRAAAAGLTAAMEPSGESADGALDAQVAAPEQQQTELGARLEELVRQAEAQAQQVRRATEPRVCGGLTRAPGPRSWSWRAERVLSLRTCCSASSATLEVSRRCGAAQRSRSARLQVSWRASESCVCGWRKRCVVSRSGAQHGLAASRSAAVATALTLASPLQLRLRCAETKETDALRASLEGELAAVEEDVKRVEQELSAARSEARGQQALALACL